MQHEIQQDIWKRLVGEAAAKLVEDGMVIGLGTGSTAKFLIYALARRIQEGLTIVGAVATSKATADLASSLNILITNLDTHPELDLAIDGADEIDDQLNLMKGAGGALVREKIVATAARRFIVIGDVTKQVTQLGRNFPLPVETIPFAATPVRKHLEALGLSVQLRQSGGQVFISDNGNVILDCFFPHGISDPLDMQARVKSIVGVVETGLFLHMTELALIGGPDGVKVIS